MKDYETLKKLNELIYNLQSKLIYSSDSELKEISKEIRNEFQRLLD